MPTSEKALYRFDDFEIDPAKRTFLRQGIAVSISPKAFDILSYLVANSGRVVTKKELLTAVWPDSFVEESNLAQHVSWLRKAFGDRAGYIVTVPGRGFQFTATVRKEIVAPDAAAAATPTDAAAGDAAATGATVPALATVAASSINVAASKPRSAAVLAIAAVLLLAILLAGFFAYRRFAHTAVQPPASVVVLPFENLTGDPNKEYLSDGVTEEVIDALARAQGGKLRVIARTSSMSFKATSKTVREIAQELGVQYVLEGSVRSEGDQLRVAARLVRGDDQTYLWSDGAAGDATQILAFETRLTDAVARSLSVSSSPSSSEGAAPEHLPANDQAHQAYLQGLYFLAQRSKSGLENALQKFGTAVAEDPQYARAYAQLAVTYNLMGQFGWMDTGQAHNQARAAALEAIAGDANLAEAHAALGFNDWFYEWNLDAAEKELSKAVALEPTNADARHWYALLLMTKRQPAEAEQQMRAALAIDPKALILRTNLGWLHYTNRQYPLAIEEMQAVVHDDPDFLTAHYKLWWAYSMSGDTPHAMHEVNEVARLVFRSQDQTQIAEAYDHGGYPAALAAMTQATHQNPPYLLVDDARRMSFAGDARASVTTLEHALDEREGWMIVVPSDPAFDALRTDPAYLALMEKLRTSAQTTH